MILAACVHTRTEQDTEEWRPVEGQEHYEVSNLGRVRSLDHIQHVQRRDGVRPRRFLGRVLVHRLTKGGYHRVCIREQDYYVHRLVLQTFVGPPFEGAEGAHWDGDKANNRLSNLRWATSTENHADKERHGTKRVGIGERHACAKLSEAAVVEIRTGAGSELSWAKRFGVSPSTIYAVRIGRTWKHVGMRTPA